MQFSANLGFLFREHSLPDAIRAAKAAGFDAVECHWPYDTPVADVNAALSETGLVMLGLNTRTGDTFGLCAQPDTAAARAAIDEAVAYAVATKTRNVHVMAGKTEGPEAEARFVANLQYACDQAAPHGIGILIEPLNHFDVPGYFLTGTAHAMRIIGQVDRANVKIMYDCYHMQRMQGEVVNTLQSLLPHVGHVQIAACPDRGAPDHGELDYGHVLPAIAALGWTVPIGAEYKPVGATADSLGWMARFR